RVDEAFGPVGASFEAVQLRRALNGAMEVATAANQYLDARQPWVRVKEDREHAAETLFVALNVISGLASLLNPILPFTSQRVWTFLAHDGEVQPAGWQRTAVLACTTLPEPGPIFKKLDDSVVEEETARLAP